MLESDVEIGGSDQLFNMLVGRSLQKENGQPEQAVLTLPLLVGLDGKKKMSKSYDNYIAFNDHPKEMFGKIMSIPDHAMWSYFELLLEKNSGDIQELKSIHPMAAKKTLAVALTGIFHEPKIAEKELQQFEKVFSKNENPDEMLELKWADLIKEKGAATLLEALFMSEMFKSKGDVRRIIQQGGVKINKEQVSDPFHGIDKPNPFIVIQAGKRKFIKIFP